MPITPDEARRITSAVRERRQMGNTRAEEAISRMMGRIRERARMGQTSANTQCRDTVAAAIVVKFFRDAGWTVWRNDSGTVFVKWE